MRTPAEWRMVNELEKYEGGAAIPCYPEPFLLDTGREFAPQIVAEVLGSWAVISKGYVVEMWMAGNQRGCN